jgi:hypothetical protein
MHHKATHRLFNGHDETPWIKEQPTILKATTRWLAKDLIQLGDRTQSSTLKVN